MTDEQSDAGTADSRESVNKEWQAQVQRENADQKQKLADAKRQGIKQPGPGDLPPADFMTLVSMFSTQAMVALGIIPHPSSGKPEPELPLARHFIDMLGVLEEKTKGNLNPIEERSLRDNVHHLRIAYIESTRSERAGR